MKHSDNGQREKEREGIEGPKKVSLRLQSDSSALVQFSTKNLVSSRGKAGESVSRRKTPNLQ
jgi:hypothetical protein